MHWLTHNAIADMPGPRYLLVYGILVLITIVIVRIKIRRLDPSLELDPPTVPGKLSAHQIAHLRGGAPRVLAVVLYDLCRRGYLQVLQAGEGGPMIGRSEGVCPARPTFQVRAGGVRRDQVPPAACGAPKGSATGRPDGASTPRSWKNP